MPDTSMQPAMKKEPRPSAAMLDAGERSAPVDDDLALGCECAYPALQIERWGQQVQAFPRAAS
jgi:hypothetical protein